MPQKTVATQSLETAGIDVGKRLELLVRNAAAPAGITAVKADPTRRLWEIFSPPASDATSECGGFAVHAEAADASVRTGSVRWK